MKNPRRTWKRVGIAIISASIVGLIAWTAYVVISIFSALGESGVFDEEGFSSSRSPSVAEETTTAETTSTTLPATDTTELATTITSTTTTTTTLPTTTTTTLPGFYWEMEPMRPGLLLEYSVPQIGQEWAYIAVIVLEKGQKTIPVSWKDEPAEVWATLFDMGEDPDPEVETHIIVELVHSDLWRDDITAVCTIRNGVRFLGRDPGRPMGAAADIWCRAEPQEVAVGMLEVGRLYVVDLLLSVDCSKYPAEVQGVRVRELCFQGSEERSDALAYNRQLVEALKGGEMPEGVGISTSMWIPPAGSVIPLTTE